MKTVIKTFALIILRELKARQRQIILGTKDQIFCMNGQKKSPVKKDPTKHHKMFNFKRMPQN